MSSRSTTIEQTAIITDVPKTTAQQAWQHAPLRFVTATSLFDGHDAAINIIRRMLQDTGAEVIHLGHNRSVDEVITTALQEDAQGIAISAYQGGHMEFFRYVLERLKVHGAGHIQVFGGGGGVIRPDEIATLQEEGVARIFSPQDGMRLGLQGMIAEIAELARRANTQWHPPTLQAWEARTTRALATAISGVESLAITLAEAIPGLTSQVSENCPVLGITGTGGAGKSSFTDELIRRFRSDADDQLRIGILAIDPTRSRTGGALLGDRVRMNAVFHPNIFMRSLATRGARGEIPECLPEVLRLMQAFGFDLIVVETPGIGQGDAGLVSLVDSTLR